ncbi:hypothetical protein [Sphaerisporangium album]|nr:hypothetical protein [Sphaerisporangium album]
MPVRSAQDWHVLGVVDVPGPGRYEILYSNAQGAAVRPIEAETDDLVTVKVGSTGILHTCNLCSCCQTCACAGTGDLCWPCDRFRRWVHTTGPQLDTYLAACAAPEGWFVETGSRIVHAVGCSALNRTVSEVTRILDDNACPHDQFYDPAPPVPVRADTIRGGRRCRICCPDITLTPGGSGLFAAGGGREV